MGSLEDSFRRGARIVRMDIRTTYARKHTASGLSNPPSQRTLWGVFHGGRERARLLYVFSGPGRLAGTTLLMHDRIAMDEPDEMWLYLRSFEIFKKVEAETRGVMVPGTALSYEDARAFIPLDKYRFSFTELGDSGDGTPLEPGIETPSVGILACPRSDSIRKHLGYRSLLLRVDSRKRIVLEVRYTDLGGRPLKTYSLLRDVQVGDRFFPGEIRLENIADGFVTEIYYEHWLPEAPPSPRLFEPSVEQDPFIDRLQAYLTQVGQGARIREELARSHEQFQRFEDRLRRIQEAERLGRPFRE